MTDGEADPTPDVNGGADADEDGLAKLPPEIREQVPTWDDEYLDRVSDRLMYSYDLERDHRVRGESFDLYGELRLLNQKQFLHPALSYADHESEEHVFARRTQTPTVAELERLVDLGHDLADERIDADEQHYETTFTFVLVAEDDSTDSYRSDPLDSHADAQADDHADGSVGDSGVDGDTRESERVGTAQQNSPIPGDVREYVAGFRDRTLLKFGYYGHYEVSLLVVAPHAEDIVASKAADLEDAFAIWGDVEREPEGFFSRFAKRFWT